MNTPDKQTRENLKKTKFFSNIAVQLKTAYEHHKKWLGENWKNVTQHCLVEVARVDVLANLIDISKDIREKLKEAAFLHDVNKKQEIEMINKKGKNLGCL